MLPGSFILVVERLATAAPRRIDYGWADLRGDVFGGLTAGGIILAVAIGLGVISGLGAAAGLHGALAVCLFVALFGGTRGMLGGPNITVTVVMAVVVADYADSLAQAATIGILAGLIQIVFSLLRLGRYASFVPASLLSGFLAAIGILVIFKQSIPVLGGDPATGSIIDTVASWPEAVRDVNFEALALAAICLALVILWRGRLVRMAPPFFVALAVGILAGVLLFPGAPTVGEVPSGLPSLQLSAISLEFFLRALQPAFIMALLGSIGTLLLALRLDTITGSQHKPNQEILAQGMGNIAAGLVGGMPGAMAQGSLLNTLSGGRSPVSGLIVVALILATLLFLGPVVERVPHAVLAAILILVGWNLIDWRLITSIHRMPRTYAIVLLMTCFLVVFVDMFLAFLIGLVMAVLFSYRRQESLEVSELVSVPLLDRALLDDDELDDDEDPFQARTGLVVFPDRVTVASARQLSRILRPDIKQQQFSIFDFSRTVYIDDTASVIISELIGVAVAARSRTIVIAGLRQDLADTLHSMRLLDRVPAGNFAADLDEAKQVIRPMLRQGSLGQCNPGDRQVGGDRVSEQYVP